MIPVAEDPDVPQFLADELRERITALADPEFIVGEGWIADRVWSPPPSTPNAPPPKWQIIIRDDGISDGELGTGECSIGVRALAGSKQNPAPARRLALIVKRIIRQTPRAERDNPVSAVTSFLGPYGIEENASTYAWQYSAVTLSIVGTP